MEMVDYIATDRRRGCLAAFAPSDVSPRIRRSNEELSLKLLRIVDKIHAMKAENAHNILLPLPYRRPPRDVRKTLHRWDNRPPSEIFETGFQARDCGECDEICYYDLRRHVESGQLLSSDTRTPSAYVSTTKMPDFMPVVDESARERMVYQYHIRAPGGIRVNKAMKKENVFRDQKEIAFVQGIDRAFIVSVTPFYCDRYGNLERRGEEERNLHFAL